MPDAAAASPDIYPSLTYDDAPDAIEWLCRVFGFTQRLLVPKPDGGVLHSELSIGSGVIMVSSPKPEQGRVGQGSLTGVSLALSIRVEDPDAHFARAEREGAKIVQGLRDEEFGSRGYMAEDPEGNQWYFGTYRAGAYWGGETDEAANR